jgi:hypothetical protein
MAPPVQIITGAIRPSYSFTRPGNATPYAAGQLVANNTVAASVVPMSWRVGNATDDKHTLYVTAVRFKYDDPDVTNASFRVHLYKAAPAVATTGDAGVYGSVVSGYADWLGSHDVTAVALHADGAAGLAVPTEGAILPYHLTSLIPGSPVVLYGLIEARAAYTPKTSGVIACELLVEMS